VWMDRSTSTFSQMGGEGVAWVGQAPFTTDTHVFANLGDGTYFHSGLLAIRQSIAAGVNITYKVLYNDAVAMTGGQLVGERQGSEGDLAVSGHSVLQIQKSLVAEGVRKLVIVTDEPQKYAGVSLESGVTVHHRDELDSIQREFRELKGTTAFIYDQTCATEKRRRRKRGTLVNPAKVVLINEAAADRFFKGREPLGARIAFWGTARTIVGIVADEKFQGLTAASPIAVYAPLSQVPSANGSGVLLLKSHGDLASLARAARRIVAEVDPEVAVFGVEPLQNTVARSVSRQRFTMLLLGLFAGLALLLAAIGIHGVLSYGVAQRTREIAIRMALGERPRSVRTLVVGEALALGVAGLVAGIAGAYALTRLLTALLFGVTATDPLTFAAVPVVLLLVSLAASYAPARRATRVDPASALKAE